LFVCFFRTFPPTTSSPCTTFVFLFYFGLEDCRGRIRKVFASLGRGFWRLLCPSLLRLFLLFPPTLTPRLCPTRIISSPFPPRFAKMPLRSRAALFSLSRHPPRPSCDVEVARGLRTLILFFALFFLPPLFRRPAAFWKLRLKRRSCPAALIGFFSPPSGSCFPPPSFRGFFRVPLTTRTSISTFQFFH